MKDLNNEILDGTFYAEELQKIYKTDGIFKIESILKRRKKQQEYLVKWSGYPATFNSWIPAKQLVVMLKLSKPTADRIGKVVIVFAITISLYNLSTNSAVDFSIIDFHQNLSNFAKQCITKHLR